MSHPEGGPVPETPAGEEAAIRAAENARTAAGNAARIAWFTPLPPMPSGVSDYSVELVPRLAERSRVDVFCPPLPRGRRLQVPEGARRLDPRAFLEDPSRYDACFYHLGNSFWHAFVHDALLRRPAVLVLHDLVLHHLLSQVSIDARDPRRYEATLFAEAGELGTRLARLRRDGVATEFEKFLFPLTAHVARRARGIVVHSRYAAAQLGQVAPDVPITVVPHHAGDPPPEVVGVTREEARARLGFPPDAFIVGQFGFVTIPKQPAAVVGGFAELAAEFPQSLLVIVGQDFTGGELGGLVRERGLQRAVRIVGYVDLVRFYLYLKAADAVINLRYPSAGESSGTFARSLAEGRAVIVNNTASFAEVPPDVALKVEVDAPQAEQVAAHLLALARDPAVRAAREERARRYARERLDPARCRNLYLAFGQEIGPPGAARRATPGQTPARGPAAGSVLSRPEAALEPAGGPAGDLRRMAVAIHSLLRARDRAAAALVAGAEERGAAMPLAWIVSRWPGSSPAAVEGDARAPSRPAAPSAPPVRGSGRAVVVAGSAPRGPCVLATAGASGTATGASRAAWPLIVGEARRLPWRERSAGLGVLLFDGEELGGAYGPVRRDLETAILSTLFELGRVLVPGGLLLASVPLGASTLPGAAPDGDGGRWEEIVARSPFRIVERRVFAASGEDNPNDGPGAGTTAGPHTASRNGAVLCAVMVRR